MADNVTKLELVQGDGHRIEPDALLEAAKGKGFASLCIAGRAADGTLWLSSTVGAGQTLILLEKVKARVLLDE